MTNFLPSKLKVSDWNEGRHSHYELIKALERGELILLCDQCGEEVMDQMHVDFSVSPPKRQVVCTKGHTAYRYE